MMSLKNIAIFVATSLLITMPGHSIAQERVDGLDVKKSWVFSPIKGIAKGRTMVRFASDEEAEKIVEEITSIIGLPARFDIYRGPVGNAAARIENGKRVIYYSQDWVSRVVARDRWQAVTLLAHEIGHHLASHTLTALSDQRLQELEADRFAGSIVARLGGTLADAQRLYEQTSKIATSTHPGRAERLEAVAVGWKDGGGESGDETTSKVVATPTKVRCGSRQRLVDGRCVAKLRSKSRKIERPRKTVCKQGQRRNSLGKCYWTSSKRTSPKSKPKNRNSRPKRTTKRTPKKRNSQRSEKGSAGTPGCQHTGFC